MNKTANVNTKRVFPIRFARLEVGSDFTIFAEPSRGVRKSKDQRTYVKDAEAYSTVKGTAGTAEEVVAILYPEDLVVPLSRGARR